MANATEQLIDTNAPALARLRALFSLLFQLAFRPERAQAFERLAAEADHLIAQLIFEAAIRISGRNDLREAYEAVASQRGGLLHISLRARPQQLDPRTRIMLTVRRARAIARYRTAMGCRHRCSSKRSVTRARNQRRTQRPITSARRASAASPYHTPSRISAPP